MVLNRVYILQKLKSIGIEDVEDFNLEKLIDIIEVCLSDFKDELN